jgi:hypothetical protein
VAGRQWQWQGGSEDEKMGGIGAVLRELWWAHQRLVDGWQWQKKNGSVKMWQYPKVAVAKKWQWQKSGSGNQWQSINTVATE